MMWWRMLFDGVKSECEKKDDLRVVFFDEHAGRAGDLAACGRRFDIIFN